MGARELRAEGALREREREREREGPQAIAPKARRLGKGNWGSSRFSREVLAKRLCQKVATNQQKSVCPSG